ncbi:MAG: hypothetical protein OEZ36_07900 [Spirochaetota bacterium]|nr:hypothetical protein [Spirochaetota bacterium]
MSGKILKHVGVTFFVMTLCFLSVEAFSSKKILSGGDTKRNPVVGLNFMGNGWFFGGEVEVDFKMGDSMSLAPRLGLVGFNTFAPGVSLRFGIIDGKRPHGFWAGPAVDFIIYGSGTKWAWNKNYTYTSGGVFFVPAGEFGWRYTFDFGLSLQALTRLGALLGGNAGNYFYWSLGPGVAYAF